MRERMSERVMALWEDHGYAERAKTAMRTSWQRRGGRSAEDRARIGERSRRLWADPAFRSKMRRAISLGRALRRERLGLLATPEGAAAQRRATGGARL
jgi:hypothetical protein